MRGWGDGLMSENCGCTSVRTWVQIPSSHVTLVLGGKVQGREDCWLPA